MRFPLQIQFHKLEPSPAVEDYVRKQAQRLDRFFDRIGSCRVTIEAPHKHHHQGNIYHVTVDLKALGEELVASRSPGQDHAHEDVYVAIRDAFNAVRRQLQDEVNIKRGRVKSHDVPSHGKISEIHAAEGYGKITDSDGREIYFHRNSLVKADFDDLELGSEVRFEEEAGDKGPQASSVHLVGKHHVTG